MDRTVLRRRGPWKGRRPADVKSFTPHLHYLSPPLPRARALDSPRGERLSSRMFASLQTFLPSSVLSSISNNPPSKNNPHQDTDDDGDDDPADRDSHPSSPSNNRPMAVDERGVMKKKGKSNEVSLSLFASVDAPPSQTPDALSSDEPSTQCISQLSIGIHRRSTPALKDKSPSQPPGPARTTQLS